jgi:hypothetical protein
MVSYGDTSTPNRSNRDNSYTDINPGPYIAIVKDNVDATKMGGLKVLIPSLSGTDEGPASMLYDVKYLMPFYGAKSPNATAGKNITEQYDYASSQHSYGMWMVPPDIDSRVMVTFVEGKVSQGYWFGCVQEPYINHMMPGIAASKFTQLQGTDPGEAEAQQKTEVYGTDVVPAGEVNRQLFSYAGAAGIDKQQKPIHPFANTLRDQGLIQDTVRGTTTSSARRESPSAVFGISTPGRINEAEKKFRLGPNDAKKEGSVTRGTGHTFVMDDGDAAGDNQLIRLRTGSGHQLLMHDTKGVVYLANGSGNVWMEFSDDGSIDIYAGGGINIRSKGDMNFHSEKDINMYANNNFKIKANQNYEGGSGERSGQISIDGSDIKTYASRTIHNYAETGWYAVKAGMSIYSQAGGQQIHQANGRVDLVGSQVHFNSIGADPSLVQPLKRSDMGTAEIDVTDVTGNLVTDSSGNILVVNGKLYETKTITGMTGMIVPTHEPYDKHKDKKK